MNQTFPIIPATSGPLWLFAAVAAIGLALIFLFAYLTYASRHTSFEVSAEGLRISGDLYGRSIPFAALDLEAARAVDLSQERDLRLKWRTNGAGLPGYSAGWFKLANGDKALVFVTDRKRVLYLPTTQGYAVLMSTPRPAALLEALRARRG